MQDVVESTSFDTSEKDFSLPEEFDQLIAEEGEKIRKAQEKESNYLNLIKLITSAILI